MDTKAGEVDTWPAHASGLALSSSAAMLSKNKSLVILKEEEGGKAPIIPKPRFLEQLENFLRKELHALGVTEVTPSDLRLQVCSISERVYVCVCVCVLVCVCVCVC